MVAVLLLPATYQHGLAANNTDEDLEIALSLAQLLRSARSVIAGKQSLINDPMVAEKGLTSEFVIRGAAETYREAFGHSLGSIDPESRHGRLLAAQIAAIGDVMDEHQTIINRAGVGFKGFVPAIFARLVNERFKEKVGDEVEIKVTAPPHLVRNRKARPDAWEVQTMEGVLMTEGWPRGEVLATVASVNGHSAFRVLVPEYYSKGCLSCHGTPKGELDVTGHPKEGGQLDELGGMISIILYR